MLSDRSIRQETSTLSGHIRVDNGDDTVDRVQPASLDIRLGSKFSVMKGATQMRGRVLDLRRSTDEFFVEVDVPEGGQFHIHPGQFVLATTMETVTLSPNVAARVEGKSSLGRLGLFVHVTAGFIDPGFSGEVTLELLNATPHEMVIYPGMPIGQLSFNWMDLSSEQGYTGKYQGLKGPALPQFWKNFS